MSKSGKLSVTTENGTILLSGTFNESSNILGLKEALSSEFRTMDFRNLETMSWNGLLKLDGILKAKADSLSQKIVVDFMPAAIYRFYRMLPGFVDTYDVKKVEFVGFDSQCDDRSAIIGADDFLLELNKNSRYLRKSESLSLPGRKDFYPGMTTAVKTIDQYSASFEFLLDYTLFSDTIVNLSIDLTKSLTDTIARIHDELRNAKLAIEKSFFETDLGKQFSFPAKFRPELTAVSNNVDCQLYETGDKIQKICLDVSKDIKKASNQIQITNSDQGETLSLIMNNYLSAINRVKGAATLAEDMGVSAGELFEYNDIFEAARKIIAELESIEMSDVQINEVISQFSIMDPMADEKEYLLDNLKSFFDGLEGDFNSLSVVSQGCDLLRQILEHRLKEATLTEDYLTNFGVDLFDSGNFPMFKADLLKTIKLKLVTDQEKISFSFFIIDDAPEVAEVADESAKPGDMMMF